ncbi:hypothetical protein V074_02569 [Staphylococcus aureus 2010-60-1240-1]|uniref:hypothetical protein n=1 Tax=Staphylococcus aureus TaxID=1280 RepID=UPI0004468DDC|nr:hypothetical protein [Staphylococcus aureus]EZV57614.1 hypothetical protein V074_02569 [Staphylococcus aureus 2010-60-1240-1]
MSRAQLKKFKNKNVTVKGIVTEVVLKNKLDIEKNSKFNVRVLLKQVVVSGVEVDHLWFIERNSYYDDYKDLMNQEVKFKGKVNAYVKNNNGFYQEDYAIERSSKLLPIEVYEREKPFKR